MKVVVSLEECDEHELLTSQLLDRPNEETAHMPPSLFSKNGGLVEECDENELLKPQVLDWTHKGIQKVCKLCFHVSE